jgi:enamine deaminase RidA (YjgF/YER057c/UK114 family)
MSDPIEEKLAALGITLPVAGRALGTYAPAALSGSLVFVSGQGPIEAGGIAYTGRVGEGCSIEDARAAARLCMVNVLAQVREACGGRLQPARCLSVTVYVSSGAGFFDQPLIADAATELVRDAWGADRLPTRSAVGVHALPKNVPVMIEAVFER